MVPHGPRTAWYSPNNYSLNILLYHDDMVPHGPRASWYSSLSRRYGTAWTASHVTLPNESINLSLAAILPHGPRAAWYSPNNYSLNLLYHDDIVPHGPQAAFKKGLQHHQLYSFSLLPFHVFDVSSLLPPSRQCTTPPVGLILKLGQISFSLRQLLIILRN